jgi:CO dehydrogenase/acetyl-CoA synthase gamma subunit (corrinoid Fe-S protein)
VLTEGGEVLRRECLECGELRGYNAHERIDASHTEKRKLGLVRDERLDEQVELVQDLLEPQLARLMHDDEEQLIGMRGTRVLQRK